METLDAARTLGDGNPRIPQHAQEEAIRDDAAQDLRHHRIVAVARGFRSSFRDWVAEETDHPSEVTEAALAHVI